MTHGQEETLEAYGDADHPGARVTCLNRVHAGNLTLGRPRSGDDN